MYIVDLSRNCIMRLILFYFLFYDAIRSTGYTAPKDNVISVTSFFKVFVHITHQNNADWHNARVISTC